MICRIVFPPTPAAVRVLHAVKPIQTLLHNPVEVFQIVFAFGMRLEGGLLFDAAKDFSHCRIGREAKILECFRGNCRRQETAHGLLGAAVWIVDQIRQRIEHRHGHTRRHLDHQTR